MKAYALSFFLALFYLVSFGGNDYQVVYNEVADGTHQLEFSINDYSVAEKQFDDQTFSILNFEGNVSLKRAGFADLPYLHASVMIDRVKNVNITVEALEYEEIDLSSPFLPSRGVIYRDTDPSTVPYVTDPKSLTDTWYPANQAEMTEPFILRDIRGVNVYVYPFQYNAVQQQLRVVTSMKVTLTQDATEPVNAFTSAPASILREMDGIYRSVFINYGINAGRDDLTVGEQGDILVVTTARDEAAIQPFVDWKRQKGYEVELLVVATGQNINQDVQDAYDANNNILYVQMVGDWADIKCNTMGSSPMDPQVGCVIGTDEYADIAVGRISAGSPADVTVQVDKIINYEKYPEEGATWYSTATGVGSNEGATNGDDSEIDYEHLDVIYNNKLDPFTYDAYNPIYDPGASSSMVHTAVNGGTSFINYCGHGSPTSWGTTGFSNSQVANLANGSMLPFIVSVACNNGDYHTGTCFGEAWLRKSDGGAVAMLAASISQPWQPPMRGQDYFSDILIGGYDYTLYPDQSGISTTEQRTTIGAIIVNGLTLMTTESGSSADWETAKTWNLFGDPSMQMRTAAPADLTITNTLVMAGIPFVTNISTSEGPFEGAMVALTQGDSTYTAFSDAMGDVEINHSLNPGDMLLVITGFNTETVYDSMTVIPPSGAYIMFEDYDVNDINGNNNGLLDYAEQAFIDVTVANVGTEDATNVTITITTDDGFVTLIDSVENYGTVAAGSTLTIPDAFEVMAHEDIPDMHSIMFEMTADDGSSDVVWASNFIVSGHAPNLAFVEVAIDDAAGNGNGKLDPGETVDMTLTLTNKGSSESFNVEGLLTSISEHITINSGTMLYGDMAPEDVTDQVYSITASEDTPEGHSADFTLQITADHNISGTADFFTVVGQIPVLIIDFDKNNNSANEMETCINNLGVGNDLADAFPENLGLYSSIFVCLGTYPQNEVLSESHGELLAEYLAGGGNLYMEGGDTWYYDQQSTPTAVHPMFSINATDDGSGDLSVQHGMEGTMCDGMNFEFDGENSYIDHIFPEGTAEQIFMNVAPEYGTVVKYDAETYRTIGSAFEFGGLKDGDNTKDELMIQYLNFFGIDNIFTDIDEPDLNANASLQVFPNPVKSNASLSVQLEQEETVKIDVMTIDGRLVNVIQNSLMKEGHHLINWNAASLTSGIYFIRMTTGTSMSVQKIIVR